MGVVLAVALLLIVGSVAEIGWGYYSKNSCQSGYGVNVERLDSDKTLLVGFRRGPL